MRFHENPSSGNQVLPGGRADRQTDMKLIVEFRSSAKSRKNV